MYCRVRRQNASKRKLMPLLPDPFGHHDSAIALCQMGRHRCAERNVVEPSVGQLEKCAEAGALRRAFPEEIGNALTAEEMEGQHTIDGAADAPEKPKPESVTPPRAGGERKPLPPLVSQPQSLTASSSAELPEPFAARQEGDPEIPHAVAPASE